MMVAFLAAIPVGWFVFVRPRQGRAARHQAIEAALGAGWTSCKPGEFVGTVAGRPAQVTLTVQTRFAGGYGMAVRLDAAVARSLKGSWYTPRRRLDPGLGFDAVFSGDSPPETLSATDRAALMELYDHPDAFVDFAEAQTQPLGAPARLSVVLASTELSADVLMPALTRLVAVASRLDRP